MAWTKKAAVARLGSKKGHKTWDVSKLHDLRQQTTGSQDYKETRIRFKPYQMFVSYVHSKFAHFIKLNRHKLNLTGDLNSKGRYGSDDEHFKYLHTDRPQEFKKSDGILIPQSIDKQSALQQRWRMLTEHNILLIASRQVQHHREAHRLLRFLFLVRSGSSFNPFHVSAAKLQGPKVSGNSLVHWG